MATGTAENQLVASVVIPEPALPLVVRLLGGRFRDSARSFRMKWGELSWGYRECGLAAKLCLFEEGFSLCLRLAWLQIFVRLPFLQRWAWHPREIMESWGFSTLDGAVHFNWSNATKIVRFPWADWVHLSHTVMRPDGSFVPFVGSWEERQPYRPDGKEPDGRHLETHPYHYLLQNGDVQHVEATISVERREWRLRWLRWTSLFAKVRHSIDVNFSDEVGERSGSWKGGTVGCGYELRPNETPRECLRRMMRDRKFN